MADKCSHGRTVPPARPIPDWTGRCPDCGETVKHNGRGGFITVREVNAWIVRQREAVEQFRREWVTANPLTGERP